MALLGSVAGGLRDFFVDPPEFDILHTNSMRQPLSYLVRMIMFGLAVLLQGIQSSGSPIVCSHLQNSTFNKMVEQNFLMNTCLDDIKSSDNGNKFLILDEYFGWFLALEILFLMFVTKFIGRHERSKHICKRMSVPLEKFRENEEPEKGSLSGQTKNQINDELIEQLRKSCHLTKTYFVNTGICILSSAIFSALGVPSFNQLSFNYLKLRQALDA